MGPKQASELHDFASELGLYIKQLRLIVGKDEEAPVPGIDLPAEYRWEIMNGTEHLISLAKGRLGAETVEELRAFSSDMEKLHPAPPLYDPRWANARTMGTSLLSRLIPVYEPLEPILRADE